ncbi:MAG: hypothetical protein JST54_11220 [Deltaproteobacteria bacterium]|nr:hypothetical protein [Deltaproteobacteria bacterium]
MLACPLMLLAAVAAVEPAPAAPDLDAGPALDAGVALDAGLEASTEDGGLNVDPAALAVAPDGGVELRFNGNKVLAEEVYRAVLDLSPTAKADAETAKLVQARLETLLHRAGYELGTVRTRVVDGRAISVDIDEGQLEKVVFRGKLTLKTLRFKLALQLPGEIFNRPELERQLRTLPAELGMDPVWYELVPTKAIKTARPQVESLGPLNDIQGYEVLRPQSAYELHVFFTEHDWDTGPGLDLRTSNVDGLELIGNDQGAGLLGQNDRWRVAASAGMGVRVKIDGGQYYPTFSRAYAEAKYFASVPVVRPTLEVRGEVVSRQRADLFVENYDQSLADALITGQYEFAGKQDIAFGFGLRRIDLWGISRAAPTGVNPNAIHLNGLDYPKDPNDPNYDVPLAHTGYFRTFAELRFNYLFDDGRERFDRRHELVIEARDFFGTHNEDQFGEAHLAWQRVIPFGWDDLWLRAHGAYIWGKDDRIPFTNEEQLGGTHVRNVFNNEYVHKVGSASAEYRFSITRDIFKVSIFNDAAGYGVVGRNQNLGPFIQVPDQVAAADSVGAGFHALVEGMFQVDMYYAFGFNTTEPHFDHGFSLSLQKVF